MKCDPFILWKSISFKADDMRNSEKSKRQQKMIAQNKYYKIITDIIASPADILKRASRVPVEGTRDARLRMSAGKATDINDYSMLLSNIITLKEQQTRCMAMKCECVLRTSFKPTFSIK